MGVSVCGDGLCWHLGVNEVDKDLSLGRVFTLSVKFYLLFQCKSVTLRPIWQCCHIL